MPERNELVKGIKKMKILKFVPSTLLKSIGRQSGQSINFRSQSTRMRLRNMLRICLVFGKSEPRYAYKRNAYKRACIAYTAN